MTTRPSKRATHTPRPANIDHVLWLMDQAMAILDDENLVIAAAKLEDARWAVQCATGRVTYFGREHVGTLCAGDLGTI